MSSCCRGGSLRWKMSTFSLSKVLQPGFQHLTSMTLIPDVRAAHYRMRRPPNVDNERPIRLISAWQVIV
jgi:uncharacterized protein (DUF2461 family)